MPAYIYATEPERRARTPYFISLWSAYYLAASSVCAFAMLNQWLNDSVKAFGGLMFTCMISLWLGNMAGHRLSQRPHQIARMTGLLAAASVLTLAPILTGDAFAALVQAAGWSENSAAIIIACALFAPSMLLLAAVPPYAATLLIRGHGRAGSIKVAILLCIALGYGGGTLMTANYAIGWLDARGMMKTLLALSAVIIVAALIRHPPRKMKRR